MEALKIKLSKLLRERKRVRILATTFKDNVTELQKKYLEKYLVNIKDVQVMGLRKLYRGLSFEYSRRTPCEKVNSVIRYLSDSSDKNLTTILLVDEVMPCSDDQPAPDWRDLALRENVVCLLGLSPIAYSASSTEVLPPENRSVLTRHLVHKHRNCPQIRNVIKTDRILLVFYLFSIISGRFTSTTFPTT